MPAPVNGRPADELLQLLAVARAYVATYGEPSWVPEIIEIHVRGVNGPIRLPVPSCGPAPTPAGTNPSAEPFVPSDAQACVLEALEGRALKTGPLAKVSGVPERELFRRPGGIQELQERGLVRHHSRCGYWRPDVPPDEMAGDKS